MLPDTNRWLVVRSTKWLGDIWAVRHERTGMVLGYFTRGYVARYIAKTLNEAPVGPVPETEYSGSQWEVDPLQ